MCIYAKRAGAVICVAHGVYKVKYFVIARIAHCLPDDEDESSQGTDVSSSWAPLSSTAPKAPNSHGWILLWIKTPSATHSDTWH